MNKKLWKLAGALLAQLAVPVEQQDAKAIARSLGEYEDLLKDAPDGVTAKDLADLRTELAGAKTAVDAHGNTLRELQRARAASPVILPAPGGRLRMQFSSPALAREFAEFARDVKAAGTTGAKAGGLSPASDAAGGYTIPETLSTEIMAFVETVGFVRANCGLVPLPGGTFKKARALVGVTVHWKSYGATVDLSSPSFGELSMSAETLMGLLDVDMEFEEDTIVDTGNYLATEFGYALAAEEDRCAIAGTGVAGDGGITGALNSTWVTDVAMASGEGNFSDLDTLDYLADMEAAVWDGALANARFLMHRTIKARVKKIKDSAGLPIWQPASGGEPSEITGYPHSVSGAMPAYADDAVSTPFVLFGDFRRGILVGRRGGIRMDYSPWPGFKNAQSCFRAIERLDVTVQGYTAAEITANPSLGNPLCRLTTDSSTS